ncbi:MAG: ATP-dependent RNA helicase DbpA [Spirochaetales bacterium]|nr:ATP-dependent RNA helicase DbpA [Spirochaetales bacterium]
MNSFTDLSISGDMLKNLDDLNYKIMTPVQEESIPFILDGRDVLARAKTGSGKTAAFGIGILENLDVERFRVQSLVLCPTHELAEQVAGELRRIARFRHNIKIVKITGGLPMHKQVLSLSHQAHIVVGTPGRVLKHLERENLDLCEVKSVVLDEADRMLDMGFVDQIKAILRFAPAQRQTLCFSATFPDEILALSSSVMKNPKMVTVETQHKASVIVQKFYAVNSGEKCDLVIDLLIKYAPESTIIFCNTKDCCRRVASELNKRGVHSLALHGDLDSKERTEAIIRFSNKSSKVLIATDVAARGLDIDDLALVINYDLPFETETYVHRIGRTGRAGKEGLAVSMVKPGEDFRVKEINEFSKSNYAVEEPILDKNFDSATSQASLNPSMITLSINGGRKNKISAGDILGALTAEGGIDGSDIGKIDRMDFITFVAVRREVAERAFKVLDQKNIKGRSFLAILHD